METFSALLAICAGNSPVTGELHAQRPVTRGFDVFFDLRLNKRLSKQSWAGNLRRHRAHYDVIVMHASLSCGSNPAWPHWLTSIFTHSDHAFLGLPCFLMLGLREFVIDFMQDIVRCNTPKGNTLMGCCPLFSWPYHLSRRQRRTDMPSSWWRHQMETFSALLVLCAGNSSLTGEFLSQRPVTRSFDVFFDLCLNKRLSKHSWGWWFETPSRPLWHRCNGYL